MATAVVSPHDLVAKELANGLSAFHGVGSIHLLKTERALSVWVGFSEDSSEAERNQIYSFEDEMSERYPAVFFDFHIVSIPRGRKAEDFISIADQIFERSSVA